MEQDNRVYEIVDEIDKNKKKREGDLITLSSGVVLKAKPVPPMILAKIDQKYPDPPVPSEYDEDRGRPIPNPLHPDYLAALEKNSAEKGMAIIDVIAGLGTTVHSIPTGLYKPEDEEWIEPIEFFGVEVPRSGTGRYLAWLKYYIIKSGEDLAMIARKSAKSLGVPEEEVASAIANFQGVEERSADTGNSTQE